MPAPTGSDLAFVDQAVPVPAGEPFEMPAVDAPGPNAPNPADCGTRTGRNASGSCEFLATRDAGYVQQVLLPQGRFVMGRVPASYNGEAGRARAAVQWAGAPPRYALAQSVWMDLHEVSRETYQGCIDAGKCSPAKCADGADGKPTHHDFDERLIARLPQTCVSQAQAQAFCAAHGARLPTEVEWEYAARGVDARVHPWGPAVRDELGPQLVPTGVRVDESYFHLLGFGSSGGEWVADTYAHDHGLRSYLAGPFRQADGPLAASTAMWEGRFLCPEGKAGCRLDAAARTRHVIKGPTPSHVGAAYASVPADFSASSTPEGWAQPAAHPQVGFRCAADPSASDPQLTVPATPPQIPLLTQAGALEVFGGAVAEVVNLAEAKAFCTQLRNPGDGDEVRTGWRLPTIVELQSAAAVWRGPGPFWAADGAVVQDAGGWVPIEAAPTDALLARCVRG